MTNWEAPINLRLIFSHEMTTLCRRLNPTWKKEKCNLSQSCTFKHTFDALVHIFKIDLVYFGQKTLLELNGQ